MKIETASSCVPAAQQASSSTTPPRPTGLGNWLNEQIRSGQISLDDSSRFMAMTMPVAGPGAAELSAATDMEQIDFGSRVSEGVPGAQSRGDGATWKMLQPALQTMTRRQAQALGVDLHA